MAQLRFALSSLAYRLGPARWYRPAYAKIADAMSPKGPILDVGCGPGGLSAALARRHPFPVVGLDRSPIALAFARRETRGLDVRLVREDAADTGFATNHFSAAVAVQAAHHWPSPGGIIEELSRIIEPGGDLWLYEADAEREEVPVGWVTRRGPWPSDAELVRRWGRWGMASGPWSRLLDEVRSRFDVVEDRHGFYRRARATAR